MKKIYEKLSRYILLRAALFLTLGILLIIFPGTVVTTTVYIVAAAIIISGAVSFFGGLKSKSEGMPAYEMVLGVIMAIAGILMCIFPTQVEDVLSIFIGVLLILAGFSQLFIQIKSKDMGGVGIARTIISVAVVVGGVLAITLFSAVAFIYRLLGIFIALMGANELLFFIRAKQLAKQVKKVVNEKNAQADGIVLDEDSVVEKDTE